MFSKKVLHVVFDTFELNVIFDMITGYIRLHGDFRFVVLKYYYGKSGRGEFWIYSIQWI